MIQPLPLVRLDSPNTLLNPLILVRIGIEHGFTVFDTPAYDEWVDHRSWNEMSTFLMEVFNEIEYGSEPPIVDIDYHVADSDSEIATAVERMSMSNDTDMVATVAVETIMYDDNGFPLEGYLAMPMEGEGDDNQLYPAVIIVPDWDGVNGPTGYEAERAVMMAKEGPYVAMVADIYGTEYTSVEEFDMKIKLSTKYRSDPDLFVGRIQAAINMLIDHPNVDTTQIFVAGYWYVKFVFLKIIMITETLESYYYTSCNRLSPTHHVSSHNFNFHCCCIL